MLLNWGKFSFCFQSTILTAGLVESVGLTELNCKILREFLWDPDDKSGLRLLDKNSVSRFQFNLQYSLCRGSIWHKMMELFGSSATFLYPVELKPEKRKDTKRIFWPSLSPEGKNVLVSRIYCGNLPLTIMFSKKVFVPSTRISHEFWGQKTLWGREGCIL